MTRLYESCRNGIWHAFAAITEDRTHAPKSKLKVLVGSLGTILECSGTDNGLEDFGSAQSLNFVQFDFYLRQQVFSSLGDPPTPTKLASLEARIDEACWIISKSKLALPFVTESATKGPSLVSQSSTQYKLFRLFCLLADLVTDEEGKAQVLLCSEEAELVFYKFVAAIGKEWDIDESMQCLFSNAVFDFQSFMAVIEIKFLQQEPFYAQEIIDTIDELYEEFVLGIIKKGPLLKRGEFRSRFQEKQFILQASGLTYYVNPTKVKEIPFDADTRVEETGSGKLQGMSIITSDRIVQLATLDKRYRTQWVGAIKLALSRFHSQESYGRFLRNKRRLEWHRIRIRRQLLESERTRELLMAEKRARIAAQDQAKELAQQKALEEEQRRHLDQVRVQLEQLLADEIQAKKDEEIVRTLQAQILNEEWEKREELERLQEQQNRLLDMERIKTKTFELRQTYLERKLSEAGRKLKELEQTKDAMDTELGSYRQKNAERNRDILENRLRLFTAPIVEDDDIRRTRRSVSLREPRQVLMASTKIGFDPLPPLPSPSFQSKH